MKKLIVALALVSFLASCKDGAKKEESGATPTASASNADSVQYFGEKITEEGAMPSDSAMAMMGDKTEMKCKLTGKVDAVCQKKGCWMELKNADGTSMRVTFKDYGFFMPKDCSGKTAIVDGIAKVEVTSVADLKEYASDNGKSKEEVAAITEPSKELVFEASGVILK